MEDLLTFIVRSIVSEPDAVSVSEGDRRGAPVLRVHVAEGDRGVVIGRGGRTVQAIETVLAAAASPRRAPDLEVATLPVVEE